MKHKSNKNSVASIINDEGKKPLSDGKTGVPTLPETTEQQALFNIITYSSEIHNAVARIFGLKAWFKAYIMSNEFAQLEKDFQSEAFDTYDGLLYVLESLERDTDKLTENYPHN